MRGVGLTLVTVLASACAQPGGEPSAAGDGAGPRAKPGGRAGSEAEAEAGGGREGEVAGRGEAVEPRDSLLAEVRTQVRGGRVSAQTRAQLLASADPDHRHAARLLQAIAGESPAEPLARDRPDPADAEPDAQAGLAEPAARPDPDPDPDPAQPEAGEDMPVPAPPAKIAVAGEPGSEAPEASEGPEPAVLADMDTVALALGDEGLPVLLEAPVLPATPGKRQQNAAGEPAKLVILTGLELRAGAGGGVELALAGAGPVSVAGQPLADHRLRLWIADAGAVPSFLAARPAVAGLAVVAVERRDAWVAIEVELAPGWAPTGVVVLDNGARVQFEPVDAAR